jgi:hypothetical protein
MLKIARSIAILLVLGIAIARLEASEHKVVQFFGSGPHPIVDSREVDPAIPSPDEVLGFALGERPAHQAQVLDYFRRLDEGSDRVRLVEMGRTYENRPLVYVIISSETNMARLDEIRQDVARIADPRSLSRSDLERLVEKAPAVVWLAYSIHGDEISGVDASLAVAYRLAAGTDTLAQRLREELVVLIDPVENPDGRERYLAQMESFATAVSSADGQSLQRGGFWPWGRGNHYLFDMNRDWFTQELVESQARIAAVVEWNPQVLVDAHEMGQWDTYLFSPPRQPFNLHLPPRTLEWWNIFAADQGKAFDQRGWAYYTREWNEEWFPGYGSSWPLYAGAVGILYEQAGVSGSRISRHDGTVLTYAETVDHHYVSSIANATTAANHRKELLLDYYNARSRAVALHGSGKAQAFLVRPDKNSDRQNHLAEALTRQGIELTVATTNFSAQTRGYYEARAASHTFEKGTLIIHTGQPQGYLIQTILGFDQRVPDSFLAVERKELLKKRGSKLYEITSWSMLQAYGADAYESEAAVSVAAEPWSSTALQGKLESRDAQQGFAFDATADRGLKAIAMLLERGLQLSVAKKDLDVEGRKLPRGTVLLPRRANPAHYVDVLDTVARETGIEVLAINSGRGNEGPDLGGEELGLLQKPRVALVAGGSTDFTSVGWIWHLLDQKLGVPAALIDVARVGDVDLSIYNVLILPDMWGSYSSAMGKPAVEAVKQWVQAGGTLIAVGSGAMFCADSSTGLSVVRPREQILAKLSEYEQASLEEVAAEQPDMSKLQIWDYTADSAAAKGEKKEAPKPSLEELQKADELARALSPHGAILRANLDTEDWMTVGMGDKVPVMITTPAVLAAKFPPVRTVARFAAPESLRLSGLLWPEARLRIANSSYCTRESSGRGQIILFAEQPNFRAYFRGAERLLSNAILLGPGMGTWHAPEW